MNIFNKNKNILVYPYLKIKKKCVQIETVFQ